MSIYSYTLKKYFKSKSTWFVVLLGVLLFGFVAGSLPWGAYNIAADSDGSRYSRLILYSVGGTASTSVTFAAIFSAFKSATLFKDEVEDGTFLVLLSKPITRTKIILYKWLALLTAIFIYIVIVISSYGIFSATSDKYDDSLPSGIFSLRSKIWLVMFYLGLITFVAALIFSSLGVLISTKTSSGATIGIIIGLGVMINITSLIQNFTISDEYNVASSNNVELLNATIYSTFNIDEDNENDPFTTSLKDLYEEVTNKENGITNFGFATNSNDGYSFWKFADLNFQIATLSDYASDVVISNEFKAIISANLKATGNQGPTLSPQRTVVSKKNEVASIAKNETKDDASTYMDDIIIKTLTKANAFGSNYNFTLHTMKNGILLQNGIDISEPIDSSDAGTIIEFGETQVDLNSFKKFWQDALESSEYLMGAKDENDESNTIYTEGISYFINRENLSLATLNNNISIGSSWKTDDQVIQYENEQGEIKNYVMEAGSYDARTYVELQALIQSGKPIINMVEVTTYMNKESVLIVYILFALGLIPLSLWIVKKQDFK